MSVQKKKHKLNFTQKVVFSFCVLMKKKNEQPGDGKQIGSSIYIYNRLWSLFWVHFMGTGFAKG